MKKKTYLRSALMAAGWLLAGVLWPDAGPAADKLVSLIRAESYREADKLAAATLADPAIDPRTQAVCGLALLLGGRVREAEEVL
ncbi:MAG: hypothetical protein FJY80_07765, partial [Candidatus Aminicenantes bacterium]|nr:hypothetical protein [Candidatus Aminicenantes bacterium]